MTFRNRLTNSGRGRGWRIVLAAVLIPLVGSCSDTIVTPADVATLDVQPEQVDVMEGGTVQLSADLRDDGGRPVTGHQVIWTSADDGIASVDASGRVTARARGTTSIRAQAGAAAGTAAVRVLLPPAVALSQSSVSLATGSDGTPPTPIQVAVTNGGEAELTGLAAATDYGGGPTGWLSTSLSQTTAPAMLTVGAAGIDALEPGRYEATVNISASSAAGAPVPLLVSLEVSGSITTEEAPAKLAFAQHPITARVGEVLSPPVTVRVEDVNGNRVSSTALVTVALGTNPSGATLAGTRTVAAVDGIATFGDLSVDQVAQGYTLTASADQLAPATSGTFDITAGDPAGVVLTGPASVVAGLVSPAFTLRAVDDQGNTAVVSESTTFTLGSTAASTFYADAAGNHAITSVTIPAGASTASFYYSGDVVGQHTVSAASSALGAAAHAITVTAGDADRLSFAQQPTTTVAGETIDPAVTVRIEDAVGNLVSSTATVTLSIGTNPSGAALGGTVSRPAVDGIATFDDLSLDQVGEGYTLQANSGTLSAATSDAFDITTSTAAAQLVYGQQPTTTGVGAVIDPPVTVRIEDAVGNLVSSTATITLSIGTNPSGATLGGTVSRAAVDGIATFDDLSLDQVGEGYTLQASSGTLSAATSDAFDITASTAAAQLAYGQQPTTTVVNAVIDPPVTVRIEDKDGNLVAAAMEVTVRLLGNQTGLKGTLSVTAVGGIATFDDLVIDQVGTGYRLQARAGSLEAATSDPFDIVAAAGDLVWEPAADSRRGTDLAIVESSGSEVTDQRGRSSPAAVGRRPERDVR